MDISLEKLRKIIDEAYEAGLVGCREFKQQDLEGIISKHQADKDNVDYRIWSCAELKKMPTGSVFQHLQRGRCWIVQRANGSTYMQFEKGSWQSDGKNGPSGPGIDFNSDNSPWDKPMKLLYSHSKV